MKYNIKVTARFQKDLKRMHRRGYDISLLTEIIRKLSEGKLCRKRIKTTACPETISDAENVI